MPARLPFDPSDPMQTPQLPPTLQQQMAWRLMQGGGTPTIQQPTGANGGITLPGVPIPPLQSGEPGGINPKGGGIGEANGPALSGPEVSPHAPGMPTVTPTSPVSGGNPFGPPDPTLANPFVLDPTKIMGATNVDSSKIMGAGVPDPNANLPPITRDFGNGPVMTPQGGASGGTGGLDPTNPIDAIFLKNKYSDKGIGSGFGDLSYWRQHPDQAARLDADQRGVGTDTPGPGDVGNTSRDPNLGQSASGSGAGAGAMNGLGGNLLASTLAGQGNDPSNSILARILAALQQYGGG